MPVRGDGLVFVLTRGRNCWDARFDFKGPRKLDLESCASKIVRGLSGAIEWRRAVESTVIAPATADLSAASLSRRFTHLRVLSDFFKRSNTALNSLINVACYAA